MSKRITSIVAVAALALAATTETAEAFSPAVFVPRTHIALTPLFAEETKEAESGAAFVPPEEDDEDNLETVEGLGRGAAKVSFFK
jgi:hypothetical protein